ncbi:aspartyl/asparaginyl beta-hydroxylase domain-containing protein [Nevskia soli]|uniref:aspartyl/asparaginyl beta-hydroxylase domain-containing protein n=1 Tax=Nevskia soli TaxID=418856 RepID=UPI0004A71299|nr:aspartyl/asparaginyl beta-hydroxylase domain-containing protein [Nevskia soli]
MTAEHSTGSARELNAAAMRAMAAGDFATARVMLRQALASNGNDVALWLNLAGCLRVQGDIAGAMTAVEQALRVSPRSFMALLMKGSLLERQGQVRQAARIYRPAIGLTPPESQLDAATLQALRHARQVSDRYADELAEFIGHRIGPAREKGSSAEAVRINAFIDLATGRKRNFRQEPTDFFYPGLPALEFHEREDFPWLRGLEAATAAIREELLQVLRDDFRDFVPYVAYPDGVPIDQWAELNHSRRWGALHLLLYGERVEQNCSRCPRTMEVLAQLPQPQVPQRSPAAMFSALQPKTRIPPHTGVANTRLVVHLPLIVPEGCGFRVGNQTRPWREGQAWVFDDTIEHEAWNDSAEPRIIMICDIWNPRLSPVERELISSAITAIDAFNDASPTADL